MGAAVMHEAVSREEVEARIEASHDDVRAVYAYWRVKCGSRRMPRRADIDPAELKRFLPFMMLVDVTGDERRFVYRLVGTGEVEERGYDPTGRPVRDASFGGSRDTDLDEYEYVVRHKAPFCVRDPFQAGDGRIQAEDIIYLPLSPDGERVNMILVFSHGYIFHRRAEGSAM
jgi:hypothetical protein